MKAETSDGVLAKFTTDCAASVSVLKKEFKKVRTGRASAGLLEGVFAEYYGAKTPIGHLAQITTPEPRLIMLQVFDQKAAPAIEKAIQAADLGFNPSREGSIIRIIVPTLTEESRRDIVRRLHKITEDIRVSVRNHRRDANDAIKHLEKDAKVTKDEAKKTLDKIQKHTDQSIAEIDKLLQAKEAECLEV